MRAILLLVLLWVGAASASKVVRCVDPATGKVTFTDGACQQGRSGEQVQVRRGNVIDSAPVHEGVERLEAQERARQERRREQQRSIETAVQRSRDADAQAMHDKVCQEAARPLPGAPHGQLTASQRKILAECAGISVPQDSPAYTIPAPPPGPGPTPAKPPPSIITNCDAAGCWDNQGGRYNKGAGPTHFRSDGKVCQHIGGQMHCP